ncbi:MAG TPA: hypothetical protein DHV16_07620 [Nitrospiraceae bacterium]|nr:MAG: hypothetical protein A2X55_01700 [Nitrospirae bacterium GWB2_47_37]HAK89546.1 hypothetical protein [Nitrospiraceae bacterium]HCZ12104.1 hypothetical protein [Nitrospiraceae bacterium]
MAMKDMSIKKKTAIPIIAVVTIGILITIIVTTSKTKSIVIDEAKTATLNGYRDTVLNALTTMMISGNFKESKAPFFEQMSHIADIRVIRSEALDKDYGKGSPDEYPKDEMEREVIQKGKEKIALEGEYLRGVFPYIGKANYMGKNCLSCHNVAEGAVLGAIDIKIPLTGSFTKIRASRNLYFGLGFIGVLSVAALIILIVHAVLKPLSHLTEKAAVLGTGDFRVDVAFENRDEIGRMGAAFKEMIEKVKKVITQTKESSGQVSVAADQIAEANQNFSQRITEQAASIEETSATMEEMSASIKQTAENAREANKLAQNTKGIAESGSTVMGDTINAMDEINKSSSKIANISNVIEEIAFQTNLLALNAAVEAARAGEHGKGFAVVASEIRNLAQRASQSAKEITGLIEDSVEKTGRGVQLAQELSKKLDDIGISVKKVADLMDEVAAAAGEQAAGINQVNSAVTQIDQATQQNASLVEETSASAEELAGDARELLNLISFFKVEEETSVEREIKPRIAAKKITRTAAPKEPIKVFTYGMKPPKASVMPHGEKTNGGFEEF